MIRVDIESIIMAQGPMPSVIVLRERGDETAGGIPPRALSIQTGSYEAAAVGRGTREGGGETPAQLSSGDRPIAHDLLLSTVNALDARVERIEINRVDAPVFYATVILGHNDGAGQGEEAEDKPSSPRIELDARPSDAIALAVRANAPIFVEDDVMNRAGSVSLGRNRDSDPEAELQEFDSFVQGLSPDDF